MISSEQLKAYRAETFRTTPGRQIRTRAAAVEFVRQRGFIFFWPIRDVVLPSLWTAVAGERPVANAHDDPGHITWGWKDALLGSQEWYYAKVLRKRATMISFDLAPYFYALSENYGAYDEDYQTLYEQGRLTLEARQVYEALLDQGPLDTVALRKATRMTSPSSEARFNRAITDLQAGFMILPVGVTQSGAWHYAFSYQVVARHYPRLIDQAHVISEQTARQKLVETFTRALGAFQTREVVKLFGWKLPEARQALEAGQESGLMAHCDQIAGMAGDWWAMTDLLSGR